MNKIEFFLSSLDESAETKIKMKIFYKGGALIDMIAAKKGLLFSN